MPSSAASMVVVVKEEEEDDDGAAALARAGGLGKAEDAQAERDAFALALVEKVRAASAMTLHSPLDGPDEGEGGAGHLDGDMAGSDLDLDADEDDEVDHVVDFGGPSSASGAPSSRLDRRRKSTSGALYLGSSSSKAAAIGRRTSQPHQHHRRTSSLPKPLPPRLKHEFLLLASSSPSSSLPSTSFTFGTPLHEAPPLRDASSPAPQDGAQDADEDEDQELDEGRDDLDPLDLFTAESGLAVPAPRRPRPPRQPRAASLSTAVPPPTQDEDPLLIVAPIMISSAPSAPAPTVSRGKTRASAAAAALPAPQQAQDITSLPPVDPISPMVPNVQVTIVRYTTSNPREPSPLLVPGSGQNGADDFQLLHRHND